MALGTNEDFTIKHTPEDDIESLFYVLIWITVLYDGPGGQEREDFDFGNSLLANWTESAVNGNLSQAHNAKLAIITGDLNFKDHVSPYFLVLVPLLTEWRDLFRLAIFQRKKVKFKKCLSILDKHLQDLPADDTEYTRRKGTEMLRESLQPNSQVVLKLGPNATGKRQRDVLSMGDKPRTYCKRARGGEV